MSARFGPFLTNTFGRAGWQDSVKVSIAQKQIFFKQFEVTNCSKERPGSIATKTLKNGILIATVTSKESHFNAYFEYVSFVKFSPTHQKL